MDSRHVLTVILYGAAAVLLVACADNADGDPWQFEQPPPESTVNQALCGDMPGADLDAPVVEQLDEKQWRVRYPVFERGCGVYQLDAEIRFDSDDEPRVSYFSTVCNLCEQTQQVNMLSEWGGWYADVPEERWSVPQNPSKVEAPGLLGQGHPVVKFASRGSIDRSCPGVAHSRSERYSYPSYKNLWRVTLESGEVSEPRETHGDLEPLIALASGQSPDEARLYWPRMYHRDVQITGLQAASAPEFCERDVYHGETIFDRPYAEPYRLDAKYVRQTTAIPNLPDELSDRLRSEDERQF